MENTPEFRRLGWHRPTGSSAVLTFQLPTISCGDGEAGRISMTVCAPGSNFQFDVSAETSSRFCHPVSATAACERRIKKEDSDCCQNRLNRRSSSSWKYCFWELSCFLDRDHSRSDGFSRAWKQYLERRRRFRGQSGKGAPFRAMRIQ